jgi:hypothetical protein
MLPDEGKGEGEGSELRKFCNAARLRGWKMPSSLAKTPLALDDILRGLDGYMTDNIFGDIKKRINLAEVIKEDYPLKGHGNSFRGYRDDVSSLVVFRSGRSGEWYYYWNHHNRGGDVFNYLMNERGMDKKTALEWAAQKAGLTLPEWTHKDTQSWLRVRATEDVFAVASKIMHKWMMATPAALDYARGRGWVDETIVNARLGFSGGATAAEYKEMRETLAMNNIEPESPAAVAIMGYRGDVAKLRDRWEKELDLVNIISNDDVTKGFISGFMNRPRLIYPHIYFQKITYLSARNLAWTEDGKLISEPDKKKKSYNPRGGLVGDRQPYFGWNYRADAPHIVIVEGQADAITLAQWGFNVMAQVGTSLDEYWGQELSSRHDTRYFAMDNDAAGREAVTGKDGSYPIADLLGPMTQIVNFPRADRFGELKDANDLRRSYMRRGVSDALQTKMVRVRLNHSATVAELAAADAAKLSKDRSYSVEQKNAAMMRAFDIIAQIKRAKKLTSDMTAKLMAALGGMKFADFNRDLKSALGERTEETTDESKPKETKFIFGGWFPMEEGSTKGWLVDYLWQPETKKAMFAYRDPDGRIGKAAHLDIKGVRYYPKVDGNVEVGAVMFASDLGTEKSTKELLAWNELYMKRSFLLDNPLDYKLASYYAQFTWLFDCFDELSYFRAQGESDSGKSAIALRMGYVCYRLTKSSGVGTASSFKHMQHIYRGSMFFDEVKDDLDEFDDRVVMLNIGAMKEQAWAPMTTSFKDSEGNVEFEVVNYFVYGPKICTMYGKFPQDATESRFLTIKTIKHELEELRAKNIPRRWTDEMRAQALYKRNLDMTWRLKNWQPRLQPPDSLEDMRVSTRVNQVTVPIKYILTMNPTNGQQTDRALDEINLVIKNLYEEQKFEKSQKTEARIIEAIDAVLNDPAFTILGFAQKTALDEWGMATYIRYSDLTKVVNYLIDEMNLGTGKSPEQVIRPGDDDMEEDKPKKGKKKFQATGVTASTIGRKCRELRIPVHRMGRGFVAIIHSDAQPEVVQDRIRLLKLRYGLEDLKFEESKPAPAPINAPVSVELEPEEPEMPPVQDELL